MIPVIILPVLNRFDLLEDSIRSIDYDVENLLIIDNSGQYQPPQDLYKGKLWLLNMPANMGVAGSWNLGIKCFPHAPYWVFMSNDNHWMPGALQEIERLSDPTKLVMSSVAWSTFSLGSEIVKSIGLFDENYHPAYYEDTDYMERLRIAEMQDSIVWSTIPVKQIGTATTLKSDETFIERNAFTNKNNYDYRLNKINGSHTHINCASYSLQRRIDNEWILKD